MNTKEIIVVEIMEISRIGESELPLANVVLNYNVSEMDTVWNLIDAIRTANNSKKIVIKFQFSKELIPKEEEHEQ